MTQEPLASSANRHSQRMLTEDSAAGAMMIKLAVSHPSVILQASPLSSAEPSGWLQYLRALPQFHSHYNPQAGEAYLSQPRLGRGMSMQHDL